MPEGNSGKPIVVTTIGFMCIGLVGWAWNLRAAGWLAAFDGFNKVTPYTLGGALLGLMAVLAFLSECTLESIIFFAYAGYICSYSLSFSFPVNISPVADSWFLLLWAIVFFYIWLGSSRAGWTRRLFLLTASLNILACTGSDWTHGETAQIFIHIRGYLGLLNAAIAMLISARSVMAQDKPTAPGAEFR
ncbi:MAG: hypothetical protein ACREU3_03635 [Steroidobacteraceae bacterium]